ncbi:hypothetical protein L6164_035802 [Bauhinia variegata]|uniref:Uncharacterized protein n=1 Tax=Bauhinia variegata TaxID=167791 RepID=A0ACB9KF33_BAUVA|nr:hypothetical protein L6164_035802 [Bauhinia variegata]
MFSLEMDAPKPVSAKLLKEHLQEQQEPFSLNNYFSERRYMLKKLHCDNSSNVHQLSSSKNPKWFLKYDLHKIRKRFILARGTLRSVLHKFIPTSGSSEFSKWETTSETQTSQQTESLEVQVSAYDHHNSTLLNMLQTFTLPRLRSLEVDTDIEPHCIIKKKKKQSTMKSELQEPSPNEVCHFKSAISTLSQKSVGNDPVFSAYLRKLLENSHMLKLRHVGHDTLEEMIGAVSLRQRNRRIQHKRKRLLSRCLGKARDTHVASFVTSEEWKNYQKLNSEIHIEIGDAIMDDIVKEIILLFLD